MKKILSTLILALAALFGPTTAAFAQYQTTPYPAAVYYASSFGNWQINGNSPNTFSFYGSQTCNQSAQAIPFFVFNTNAPVRIVDSTPANSQTVTPASIIKSAGSCGFTASGNGLHNSFYVTSATGGLQEALNTVGQAASLPALIVLDRNWYASVAAVGNNGPAVINAAAGTSGAILQDITTAPSTYYTWNGTQFVVSDSAFSFFNQDILSTTVMTPPTALSTAAATNGLITTATTGGTIPASSTYRLAATYVDASGGETLISTDSASTSTIATGSGTATNTISVTSPAALTGAVGYRLYMTAASGSAGAEILYAPTCTASALQTVLTNVCAIGSSATITAIVTGTQTVTPISTAYARAGGSSQAFPPFPAVGTVNAAATATLGLINFPAGYFNELTRSIQICGNGYGTTNSTPGTITVANVFSSVPGVTSITPWTVVSGTTTASAVVPFNFCETITTTATGATGTLEVHGCVDYMLAGSAPSTPACDFVIAASSTVDLTKPNQWSITIKPTTTAFTAAQVRQLTVNPAN